jgi:hypothetical protein
MGHGLVSRAASDARGAIMVLMMLGLVGVVCLALTVVVIHAEATGIGWRQAVPQPLRARGWGLPLLPVALIRLRRPAQQPGTRPALE